MLNNVPISTNKSARLVTINHPNSLNGTLFRRENRRIGTSAATVTTLPDIGGMAVLDAEDESDIKYSLLGNIYAQFAQMPEDSYMNDRGDDYVKTDSMVMLKIEPETEGAFHILKRDVIFLQVGADVHIAYEVVEFLVHTKIQPFNVTYQCNRRDDLSFAIT